MFITHHPFSISPFARKNSEDPKITDRFELIIAGMEIANAFSELNDPEDQQQRLQAQIDKKASGAEEVADICLLYTSPSPRDKRQSRMPSSA